MKHIVTSEVVRANMFRTIPLSPTVEAMLVQSVDVYARIVYDDENHTFNVEIFWEEE